jgi:glucose-1-phosphate thymidylyltransferase
VISKAVVTIDVGSTSTLPSALSSSVDAPALVPVGNRPFLFHVLDSIERAGVTHAVLVTDRRHETAIGSAVASACDWSFEVKCTSSSPSEVFRTLAGGGPVLAHFGTGLGPLPIEPGDRELGVGDAVLFTSARDGAARAPAGAAVLGARALELATTLPAARDPEAAMRTLAGAVRAGGGNAHWRAAGNWWRCRHDSESLLDGNSFVLEARRGAAVAATNGNNISGKVWIDPSAIVESSVIRGPVVVGERARVRDAYIGPYTSIGPDADIEGAEIERSIVFAGARISHLGSRLEGSVIGPRACVFRDFRLPRALRLEVGGEAQIALS